MKKLKRIAVITIAMIMMLSLAIVISSAQTVSVSPSPTLAGYTITASNTILLSSGSALTSIAYQYGGATVSGTYSYINPTTLVTGSETKNNSGQAGASISFTAPANNRSVRLNTSHSANASSQTWSGSLNNVR